LHHFPEQIQSKLPKFYHSIPSTLLGRLAIDSRAQGKGIGKILLIDALKRSFENSNQIASFAVVVDPLDEEAEKFYEKYDFIKLPDSGKMFVAMKILKELFK
jgi:ribosomal protein S18 acetylase RimI-like enzyme